MMDRQIGVDKISSYVINLFIRYEKQAPFLVYHNLMHTQTVVERVQEIASFYSLNESNMFIVLCAAWFHDCGHLFGPAKGHESRSVAIMREYMETTGASEGILQSIASCILATHLPGNPANLREEILCDADVYHFGTREFTFTDALVKREFELINNFTPANWDQISLSLLQNYQFHTQYCRELLNAGKIANIHLVQEKINRRN